MLITENETKKKNIFNELTPNKLSKWSWIFDEHNLMNYYLIIMCPCAINDEFLQGNIHKNFCMHNIDVGHQAIKEREQMQKKMNKGKFVWQT